MGSEIIRKDMKIIRGGNPFPIKLPNGDVYDSIVEISDQFSGLIDTIYGVNTDPSIHFLHSGTLDAGILKEGQYGGLCTDWNPKFKIRYITLFGLKYFDKVFSHDDLTEEMMTFDSIIPDPQNNNLFKVKYVLIHPGGMITDNSAACQTIEPNFYPQFIQHYQVGDKMIVILERNPIWIAPDFYIPKKI